MGALGRKVFFVPLLREQSHPFSLKDFSLQQFQRLEGYIEAYGEGLRLNFQWIFNQQLIPSVTI